MIPGKTYELPDGGAVWLSDGPVETTSGRIANGVVFTNPEGEKTQLGLSDDALRALRILHESREQPQQTGKWVPVEPPKKGDAPREEKT